MVQRSTGSPSRSRTNRAGDRIRELLQQGDPDVDRLAKELEIVEAFRLAHAAPLKRVAAGIRYYVSQYSTVQTEAGGPVVGQRLKRMRTIGDKLFREPHMDLSRMEDIGGCRALFGSVDEIDALIADLRGQSRWRIVRERDYIREPKEVSGYRAYHLVVAKDACRIEIQLRSLTQHAWSELIEGADRDAALGLKEGRAPADVTEYYRLGSELLAAREAGERPRAEILEQFQGLHGKIQRPRKRD